MKTQLKMNLLAACCTFAIASIAPATHAQSPAASQGTGSASGSSGNASAARSGQSDEIRDAQKQVDNATQVVKQMESDPQAKDLLQQAKGVFIVPKYGRAGLVVGGRGGAGVLLANNGGTWSNPAFYNLGGVSVGAQAGVEVGSIALMLMNQKALDSFMQDNKFSVNADAGLTIVNYTAKANAQAGRGDVIVWSDTRGAFADATIGVTDINFDKDKNAAFYKNTVAARDIIGGKVKSAQASTLTKELSSGR